MEYSINVKSSLYESNKENYDPLNNRFHGVGREDREGLGTKKLEYALLREYHRDPLTEIFINEIQDVLEFETEIVIARSTTVRSPVRSNNTRSGTFSNNEQSRTSPRRVGKKTLKKKKKTTTPKSKNKTKSAKDKTHKENLTQRNETGKLAKEKTHNKLLLLR
ncbi:6677_t:CDS:2 [Acaulospora morrowiae]|uniref:6677_t:CDS:1 n=1 Tax=Acaulospora morrowiae TaxID=94023 RepID=A0A9N9BXR4_9GLOM|nr:6677_t:CDS:2 [Acaulospora morrowiae]